MNLRNAVQLIAYPDRLGNNLKDLAHFMEAHLQEAVGGVHILPGGTGLCGTARGKRGRLRRGDHRSPFPPAPAACGLDPGAAEQFGKASFCGAKDLAGG